MAKSRNIILGLIVSALGGAFCVWLKTPLPWMIGPLVAMAICNFSGARLAAPPLGRELGQFVIAVTLGLGDCSPCDSGLDHRYAITADVSVAAATT